MGLGLMGLGFMRLGFRVDGFRELQVNSASCGVPERLPFGFLLPDSINCSSLLLSS